MRDGWSRVAVADLLSEAIGGLWGSAVGDAEVDVLVARSTEFRNDGTLVLDSAARRSVTDAQLRRRRLQPDDILLEKSGGGPRQPVGRVVAVGDVSTDPLICSNFVQLLRPATDKVVPRFLFLALWLAHARGDTLAFQSQTTGIRNLRTADYLRREILVPPVDEQHRIADLVTSVDDAIGCAAHLVDAATSAVVAWGANAFQLDTWKEQPLQDLIEPETSITYGVVKPGPQDSNGIAFVRGQDIRNGRVAVERMRTITRAVSDAYSRTLLRGGEVLVSLVGTPGEAAVAPPDLAEANVARQVGVVRCGPDLIPEFLAAFLSAPEGRRRLLDMTRGAVQQVINLRDLRRLQIPVPSLGAQRALLSERAALVDVAETAAQLCCAWRDVRSALLAALLSGDVNLSSRYDRFLLEAM